MWLAVARNLSPLALGMALWHGALEVPGERLAARCFRVGPVGRLRRRTGRLRLTALYGLLFLASGTGLLTITNILGRS